MMNPLTVEDSSEEIKLADEREETRTTVVNYDSITDQESSHTVHKPQPRLCHLKKWPHFQGYGFNLHAERAKTGQHIGKVDVDSPAESAGLREGDRIIEVNNVNISNENHQQVVKRIRNGLEKNGKFYDNEVLLLVLDHETDMYYRNLNVIVKSDFKNVLRITTVMPNDNNNDNENNSDAEEEVNNNKPDCINQNVETKTLIDATNTILATNSLSSISQKSTNSTNGNLQDTQKAVKNSSPVTSQNENLLNSSVTSMTDHIKSNSNKDAVSSASNLSLSSNNQSNSSKATTPNIQAKNETNNSSSKMLNNSIVDKITEAIYEQNSIDRRANNNNNNNSAKKMSTIDPFQMSAAEFKSYLKSKGRVDPRIAQVDMRQKFQMFQEMWTDADTSNSNQNRTNCKIQCQNIKKNRTLIHLVEIQNLFYFLKQKFFFLNQKEDHSRAITFFFLLS